MPEALASNGRRETEVNLALIDRLRRPATREKDITTLLTAREIRVRLAVYQRFGEVTVEYANPGMGEQLCECDPDES